MNDCRVVVSQVCTMKSARLRAHAHPDCDSRYLVSRAQQHDRPGFVPSKGATKIIDLEKYCYACRLLGSGFACRKLRWKTQLSITDEINVACFFRRELSSDELS
jgi:hypothetical protein